MRTHANPNPSSRRHQIWHRESGAGAYGLFIFGGIIGILAFASFLSKNKPENVRAAVAESRFGFESYYMKFEKVTQFNMADATSAGIEQISGVRIPPETLAQISPQYLRGTAILARLTGHGEAHGLGDVTSYYLILRERSIPDCQHFIIRSGATVGWLSKPADADRVDFDAYSGGTAPDHLQGRPLVVEIMSWEGDWVVVD